MHVPERQATGKKKFLQVNFVSVHSSHFLATWNIFFSMTIRLFPWWFSIKGERGYFFSLYRAAACCMLHLSNQAKSKILCDSFVPSCYLCSCAQLCTKSLKQQVTAAQIGEEASLPSTYRVFVCLFHWKHPSRLKNFDARLEHIIHLYL